MLIFFCSVTSLYLSDLSILILRARVGGLAALNVLFAFIKLFSFIHSFIHLCVPILLFP